MDFAKYISGARSSTRFEVPTGIVPRCLNASRLRARVETCSKGAVQDCRRTAGFVHPSGKDSPMWISPSSVLACSCMIETKDPESFPQTLVVSSSRELACRLLRLSDPKTILRGYRALQNHSCVVTVLSGKLTSLKDRHCCHTQRCAITAMIVDETRWSLMFMGEGEQDPTDAGMHPVVARIRPT
jgi:hypothetical protein